MANQLRKVGYSLKKAFKKTWRSIKLSMTIRAAGTTFGNRPERLRFLQQFKPEDLTVTLEREPNNKYDSHAIRVIVHVKSIPCKTLIGYIPRGLSRELSKVLDMGIEVIEVKASLMKIIEGYAYKESRNLWGL